MNSADNKESIPQKKKKKKKMKKKEKREESGKHTDFISPSHQVCELNMPTQEEPN